MAKSVSTPFTVRILAPLPPGLAWSDRTTKYDIGPEPYMRRWSPNQSSWSANLAKLSDPNQAIYGYGPLLGYYGQFLWDPEWHQAAYLAG
jgi:hypothetical protein